jgi:membrane protein
MKPFLHRLHRATLRVIPRCITQTQAVAFNMFLASFPMMLVILGVVASSAPLRSAFLGGLVRLRPIFPPGIITLLNGFLLRYSAHSLRWVSLGMAGTLLAGTQMMKLIMEGFRMVHDDAKRQSFASLHGRALLLLLVTIAPSELTASLIVFGKQMRAWMLHVSSMSVLIRLVWGALYVGATLTIAMLVLSIIYRVGRPDTQRWIAVVPGAIVATLLWWAASAGLGFYLRHVPYSLVYGGLAVTIGLMLWMQFTATILFIGAAYNAELEKPAADFVLPGEYTVVKST